MRSKGFVGEQLRKLGFRSGRSQLVVLLETDQDSLGRILREPVRNACYYILKLDLGIELNRPMMHKQLHGTSRRDAEAQVEEAHATVKLIEDRYGLTADKAIE